MAFGRKKKEDPASPVDEEGRPSHPDSERTLTAAYDTAPPPTPWQIKRATRTRKIWCGIAAFFLFCSVIFTIMVEIGNTYNKPGLTNLYFVRINLSNIFSTTSQAPILNSIARTLGLYDFYQVGLWNYCEGYSNGDVQMCTHPQTLYWFNPVEIIQSQLLAGSTIALPAELVNILGLVRTVSHWMFGLFLAGACLSFVMIPFQFVSLYSRWWAVIIMIFTFLAALCITAATIIATILFIIFRDVFNNNDTVNIAANVGVPMFAMMWTATATGIWAWLIQLGLMCCCASRRDIKKGKKRGSKKAWEGSQTAVEEQNKRRFRFFGARRQPVVQPQQPLAVEEPVMTAA